MVSAAEALRSAIHEGILEKKKPTGGWKKKQYFLTPTLWLYFDSMESSHPKNSLATSDIVTVEINDLDPQQRSFGLVLYKKKKEYRAATTEDRDAWMQAFANVTAVKAANSTDLQLNSYNSRLPSRDGSSNRLPIGSTDSTSGFGMGADPEKTGSRNAILLGPHGVDLSRLCDQMKKSFSWQLQISKSFPAKDVVEFVKKQLPDLTQEEVLEICQATIDNKLIIPLKSHVFDENDTGRFKFYEAVAPKQPRNHLNMRAQSIADLMGSEHFDSKKYAEDFLRKHGSEKINGHCSKLIAQKETTIDELKEDISANYTSFIRAGKEIKTMENSVSQLKTLVLDCKRSLASLRAVTLDAGVGKREPPSYEIAAKIAETRARSRTLDGFVHDLEVCLHKCDYEKFTQQVMDYQRKIKENPDHATETQQAKVDELLQEFIHKLVEDFHTSMQTSERMHKKESHLKFLIQLGEAHLASEMCLQNYSVRIALQLRHVPSYGNSLNYVINLSRTFFTSLLVSYEDYELSFRGEKSSHFIALTVWISAQLERFASEIMCHIFPNDLRQSSSSSPESQGAASTNCVAVDVPEFKNVTKYVASALRYVFYGSRQLELAGLPTAHCLAPHLVNGLAAFLSNYGSSIRATMKEEIKRERWEMMTRTIRDSDNRQEKEIILTQSARSFYSMVQQFLRDIQRVMNPSCATSYLAEVHDAVVLEADELLIRYTIEAKLYLENPKLSSSLRCKQLIGILTNVAYIQDDLATRATSILQEYLSKETLQKRNVKAQSSKFWQELIVIGVKRYAQAIMKMSINWQEIDLSEEELRIVEKDKSDGSKRNLFVEALWKEINEVSNAQLERALRNYQKLREKNQSDDACEEYEAAAENAQDGALFSTMVLECVLREILVNDVWWELLKRGGKVNRIGHGGINKFIAEMDFIRESAFATRRTQSMCDETVKKITELYQRFHPEKKDVRAPQDWVLTYRRVCMPH